MRVVASRGRTALPTLLALLGSLVAPASGQDRPTTGRDLYLHTCANCHGADGAGSSAAAVGLPLQPPDFTESRFASREPAADWAGVVTHGGPVRAFDSFMPAFGDALSREEIDRILAYVQTLYEDKSWPRGEFNLPLALGTEKAFPEDEVVFKTTIATEEASSVTSQFIYEKRFGSQTQIEVIAPFGWHERTDAAGTPTGVWAGGVGDMAVGVKRVLFHDLDMGTIASFTFETILPTGDEAEGLGKGFTVFEPFVTVGQFLPLETFLQAQVGVELPTDTDAAENEGLFRVALGRTFTAGGEWERAFSPMVEFLGSRGLAEGPAVWDVMPEIHFTLNRRQHVMANVGVRFPLTETEGREPRIMFLLLWDWFDGGLFEGW